MLFLSNEEGKIDIGWLDLQNSDFTFPTASESVLGGIKVGSGLTITDGVLSLTMNPEFTISVTSPTFFW